MQSSFSQDHIHFYPLINLQSFQNQYHKRNSNDIRSLSEETRSLSIYKIILDQVELNKKKSKKDFFPHVNKLQWTINKLINDNSLFATDTDKNSISNCTKEILAPQSRRKSIMLFKENNIAYSPCGSPRHSFINPNKLNIKSMTLISSKKQLLTTKENSTLRSTMLNPINKTTNKMFLKKRLNADIINISNCNMQQWNSQDDKSALIHLNNISLINKEERDESSKTNNLSNLSPIKQSDYTENELINKKQRAKHLRKLLNPNYIFKQIYEKCIENLDKNDTILKNMESTKGSNARKTKHNKIINSTGNDHSNTNKTKNKLKTYNVFSKYNTDTMKMLQEANPWSPRNKEINNALDKVARLNIKFISVNQKAFAKKIKLKNKPEDNNNRNGGSGTYMFNKQASISQNNQYDKQIIKINQIRKKNKTRQPHPVENIMNSTIQAKESLLNRLSENYKSYLKQKKNKFPDGDFYYEVSPYFANPRLSDAKIKRIEQIVEE